MICPACGEEQRIELLEYWPDDRAFLMDFCCEQVQDEFYAEAPFMDGKAWREFMWREAGVRVRGVVWGETSSGASCPLDFGLEWVELGQAEAKAFVAEHHSTHARPPVGWRWGHGLRNGTELVAVAMVGRPVARALDGERIVEVTRCCAAAELPAFVRNACSKLYGKAAREARRRGFEKIITYTEVGEPAAALRGAGWTIEHTGRRRRRGWDTPGRPREGGPTTAKHRWAKALGGTE